jgi:membrane associated rhomboid family serine protease
MFAFLRDGEASAEQSELDQLVSRAFGRLDAHPYRALGLVPAQGASLSLATYAFVHGGWIHALLTCLLLLAAGPLLEAVWGTRLFAAACAGAMLSGALAFSLVHGDLDQALVGGGALVSALVAAVNVRFWEREVDVGRWLAPFAELELRMPAWGLAVGWLVYQGACVWAAQGDLPGGLENAQGLTASLAGAAAGAGFAFAFTKLGLEERFGAPLEATAARVPVGRFDIEKVQRARARGELESAFQMLRAETRRNARNRDVVLLFWEIAVEHDQAAAAAPVMLQLIREELRRGALDAAVSQWRRVGERVPGALLEPPLLLKLLPLIRSKLGDDAAVLALHQAADPANRGFTPELGAQIAREAAALEPEIAVKVAKRTLAAKSITPELASELNTLVTKLEPRSAADDEMGALPVVPSIQFDDDDAHDRSDFGAVDDLSADPEAAPAPPAAAAKAPAAPASAATAPPATSPPAPAVAPAPVVAPASAIEPSPTPEPAPVAEAQADAAPPLTEEPAPAAPPAAEEPASEDPLADGPAYARFASVRVANAAPLALEEDALLIYVSGKGQSRLQFGRIKAVSLAAVRGLGPKPVVLIDLLLSGPQPGPDPLMLVRLRSDQFDPRKLVPSAAGALEALLALVETLLKRTRGAALPDAAAGRGRPLRMFDSLDAYSSEVLRIDAG